ncbi:hypothetical protein Indivirus_1_229 [Indivirus ILV1]|uniref:Uncharacterized protein n=1 Tax=Indivirus ILV1 TaxID=1977633 RepID=A0A1V0SD14_9VIRU|nr:hypothetical protein Indivirus_1_229 [Indivirus ILV1]
MDKITTRNVAIVLLVVLAIWVVYPWVMGKPEKFDSDMREFVPVGSDRYGLRGNLLHRVPIDKYYVKPDQNVVLSQSGGEMWVSNVVPQTENCSKVQCPSWYDNLDQCWQCQTKEHLVIIPDVAPHVPN